MKALLGKQQVKVGAVQFANYLIKIGACKEAKKWQIGKDFKAVWENCHSAEWLTWLFDKAQLTTKHESVLLAIGFAESVQHLTEEPTSKACLQAAKDWVENPNEENMLKAYAAWAAAWAAARVAGGNAASAAARAAARAAGSDVASDAASAAASTAASAVGIDVAWAADRAAARAAENLKNANFIRETILFEDINERLYNKINGK